MTRPAVLLLLALALAGCSGDLPVFREQGTFPTVLTVPPVDPELQGRFNRERTTPLDSVTKNGIVVRGHRTLNRAFAESVAIPDLFRQKDRLLPLSPTERINALTLYGYALFQSYFGRDFYRWGGDLNDLDDPQERGTRASCAFGLDCSGFAALPYDLEVELGLLTPEDETALFSSRGHAIAVKEGRSADLGGRGGTGGNNGRLDTRDMISLGREVFGVQRGNGPENGQLRLLQPGDWVGRDGHFGIIVEIEGEPYYLESGGSVVQRVGRNPVAAGDAITLFARGGRLTIRRILPDRERPR